MKHKGNTPLLRGLLTGLAALAVLLVFFTSLDRLNEGRDREGRQQLETALRRAAVACYAAEGFYPPDLDYLTGRYGVRIRQDRYTVCYDVFADNLMPDITVLDVPS